MVAQREEMEQPSDINYLGFNQDQTCLAVGTCRGFRIFATENFALLHQEACGAVSLIEMLFRTSLLALVGCSSVRPGSVPQSICLNRQLSMWNTKDKCNMCQLHFNAKIHGVKMNHRRIVVLLKLKIHIFDLKTMKSLHVIDRTPSPWADPALGWLCAASERSYLATPLALAGSAPAPCGGQTNAWSSAYTAGLQDIRSGSPYASAYEKDTPGLVTVVDTYTLKPVGTVLAHRTPVQALCLNPTGQILATASTKGTVIRLFGVPALDILYSFRRGANACRIFGLLFSRDSALICASAASGTVHMFKNSEKVLGSLPLESEEATVGAAQRELIIAGAVPPSANNNTAAKAAIVVDPHGDDSSPNDSEELSEWNVVAERPERLLELCVNVPSYGNVCSRKNALQTLSAVSEYAVENTAKYAKSLLQLLPQNFQEIVDAPRAFAWVHLRVEEESDARGGAEASMLPRLPIADGLRAVISGNTEGYGLHGGYVACVHTRGGRGAGGRSEVLVATVRGCAHIYDWNPGAGGECRLRTEHSFMGWWPQSSGPTHNLAGPDNTRAPSNEDEAAGNRAAAAMAGAEA